MDVPTVRKEVETTVDHGKIAEVECPELKRVIDIEDAGGLEGKEDFPVFGGTPLLDVDP